MISTPLAAGWRSIGVLQLAHTDRTIELIKNVEEFKKSLPMKRLGEPQEIGNFVKSIIENNIKYLSGVTINFDGANSNYIF